MRKLLVAALILFACVSFVAAGSAWAGDCGACKDKCVQCKQDTCTTCDKPCKDKCEPCKPKCKPACESKCGKCKQDTCSTCKPKCDQGCKKDCNRCGGYEHPYQRCFTGTGMMCDTGCCNAPLICKRSCVDCETICKKIETTDPCTGCVTVEYVHETVCHELTRPRVIPWWFNEAGTGNIYPDEDEG